MRIYLASSWRNTSQPEVLRALRDAGHEVYDFRNPPGGEWDSRGPWWTKAPSSDLKEAERLKAMAFAIDYEYMEWAEVFVLLLPCGKSAHLEAGWATGRGKRVLILNPNLNHENELMYRLAGTPCMYMTLYGLLEALKDGR